MQWLSILVMTVGARPPDVLPAHSATLLNLVDSLFDNWNTIAGWSFCLCWFGPMPDGGLSSSGGRLRAAGIVLVSWLGTGLVTNLTAKIFPLERSSPLQVLQINDKRGKEGRKETFLWIFAWASNLVRTRTFFHESQVLDTSGLAVAHELGTISQHCGN